MPRKATKGKEGEPQPADAAQEEPAPAPADAAQEEPASAPVAPAAALTEAEVDELPRAIVRRLVKDKLSHVAGGDGAEVIVNKDAMVAFAESARIFIHYLSATSVSSQIPFSRSSVPPLSDSDPDCPLFTLILIILCCSACIGSLELARECQ
jgi:DNA polymerase epsilon subunit 3